MVAKRNIDSKSIETNAALEHYNEWDFTERMKGFNVEPAEIPSLWKSARLGQYGPYGPSINSAGEDCVCKLSPEQLSRRHTIAQQESKACKRKAGKPLRVASKRLETMKADGLELLAPFDGDEDFFDGAPVANSKVTPSRPALSRADVVPKCSTDSNTPSKAAEPVASIAAELEAEGPDSRLGRRLPASWRGASGSLKLNVPAPAASAAAAVPATIVSKSPAAKKAGKDVRPSEEASY